MRAWRLFLDIVQSRVSSQCFFESSSFQGRQILKGRLTVSNREHDQSQSDTLSRSDTMVFSSYQGYLFSEDSWQSSLEVCRRLQFRWPRIHSAVNCNPFPYSHSSTPRSPTFSLSQFGSHHRYKTSRPCIAERRNKALWMCHQSLRLR